MTDWVQPLDDSVSPNDALIESINKVLKDSLTPTETTVRKYKKVLSESLTTSQGTPVSSIPVKGLTNRVILTDAIMTNPFSVIDPIVISDKVTVINSAKVILNKSLNKNRVFMLLADNANWWPRVVWTDDISVMSPSWNENSTGLPQSVNTTDPWLTDYTSHLAINPLNSQQAIVALMGGRTGYAAPHFSTLNIYKNTALRSFGGWSSVYDTTNLATDLGGIITDVQMTAIMPSPIVSGLVYAVLKIEGDATSTGLYWGHSHNFGETWTWIKNYSSACDYVRYSVAPALTDANKVYYGIRSYDATDVRALIWVTNNQGTAVTAAYYIDDIQRETQMAVPHVNNSDDLKAYAYWQGIKRFYNSTDGFTTTAAKYLPNYIDTNLQMVVSMDDNDYIVAPVLNSPARTDDLFDTIDIDTNYTAIMAAHCRKTTELLYAGRAQIGTASLVLAGAWGTLANKTGDLDTVLGDYIGGVLTICYDPTSSAVAEPANNNIGINDTLILNNVSPGIFIDWNNDGDFLDTYDDISLDIQSIKWSRGRNAELDTGVAGTCEIELKNDTGLYSPANVLSPLHDSLLPARKVRIVTSNPTKVQFTGYIEDIIPNPMTKTCYIRAVDEMAQILSLKTVRAAGQSNIKTGTAIDTILTEAGWSGGRAIDIGQGTLGLWYVQDETAINSIDKIVEVERAFFYVNGAGSAVYEDRHHRLSLSHLTASESINGTMINLDYQSRLREIKNEATLKVYTPVTGTPGTELWRLRDFPYLSPSTKSILVIGETTPTTTTAIYYADYSDPATTVITPVASTDYTFNTIADGLGTDLTSQLTVSVVTSFAKGAAISVVNNGPNGGFLTLLKVRGTPITTPDSVTISQGDATTQALYGRRTISIDNDLLQDSNVAQDYADYLVDLLKVPKAYLSLTLANVSDAMRTTILTRDISDRITITESNTGVNTDYFIEHADWNMEGSQITVDWLLSQADSRTYWILDDTTYSVLDSTTRLAF